MSDKVYSTIFCHYQPYSSCVKIDRKIKVVTASQNWIACCKYFAKGCLEWNNMVFTLGLSKYCTMATLEQTKEIFRRADAVCFDVDSTVIREEGIDELAKFCGVGDAVREMYAWADKCPCPDFLYYLKFYMSASCIFLPRHEVKVFKQTFFPPHRTRNAMGGSVTFKTALTERLSIIKCSREQVNKLITDHPPQLTAGIK